MAIERNPTAVSPIGTARYAYITKPDEFQGTESFKVSLVLNPNDAGVEEFIQKLTEASDAAYAAGIEELKAKAEEATGKAKAKAKAAVESVEVHYPFEPDYDEDGDETGNIVVKVKSSAGGVDRKTGQPWKRKIPIFDAKGKNITKTCPPIYGGSRIAVEVELNPFCMPATDKAGISLRFKAVQLVATSGGGGGSSFESTGFGVVEGGFEGDDASDFDNGDNQVEAPCEDDDF